MNVHSLNDGLLLEIHATKLLLAQAKDQAYGIPEKKDIPEGRTVTAVITTMAIDAATQVVADVVGKHFPDDPKSVAAAAGQAVKDVIMQQAGVT